MNTKEVINNNSKIVKLPQSENNEINILAHLLIMDKYLNDSYNSNSFKKCKDIYNSFKIYREVNIFKGLFLNIEMSISMDLLRNTIHNEFDLHHQFRNNIEKYIPGAKITNNYKSIKHQPDFWILVNKANCPVEIKYKNFDKKALNQLSRYMNHFNCNTGYALAPELTVELPDNVVYVKIEIE